MNTYVYGTPHGFNFYEKDPVWDRYFQEFYRTDRRGRQLWIKRLDGGFTVYNFLCYGLMDYGHREPVSFFGFSVVCPPVVGNSQGEYALELKKVYAYFNSLFDKMVERRQILEVNEGGIIKYNVAHFSDMPDEVNWLKMQAPKIFSAKDELTFVPYAIDKDRYQPNGVARRHIDADAKNIAGDFRYYGTVAISPDFKRDVQIDFQELEAKSQRVNEELRLISRSLESNVSRLEELGKESEKVRAQIAQFSRQTYDNNERAEARRLDDEYTKIAGYVSEASSKAEKARRKAKDTKVILPSRGSDAARYYKDEADVKVREKEQAPKTVFDKIKPFYIGAGLLGALLIVGVILLFSGGDSETEPDPRPSDGQIDLNRFYSFRDNGDYVGAILYASDFEPEQKSNLINKIGNWVETDYRNVAGFIGSEGVDVDKLKEDFYKKNTATLQALYNAKWNGGSGLFNSFSPLAEDYSDLTGQTGTGSTQVKTGNGLGSIYEKENRDMGKTDEPYVEIFSGNKNVGKFKKGGEIHATPGTKITVTSNRIEEVRCIIKDNETVLPNPTTVGNDEFFIVKKEKGDEGEIKVKVIPTK